MLKGLTGGTNVVVNNNYTSMPYINTNTSNPMQGMLRVNGNDMQVFDGSTWLSVSGAYPTVELSGSANSAITWALHKMAEEEEYRKLAETSEAVKGAMANVALAQEQLKVIATLAKDTNA